MSNHETKTCPRCGRAFECKPGNITQCQCYGLRLDAELQQQVAAEYDDCLCAACLTEIQNGIPVKPVILQKKTDV